MRQLKPREKGYEEGLAAGRAIVGKWRPSSTSRLENWILATREAPTIICEDRDFAEAMGDLQRLHQEDLPVLATDLHRHKMDALPDLKIFPELAGMDQYLDEEAKGFAVGAGIDVGEILLDRYCEEIYLDIARGYGLTVAQCSEYWFPETPNGPLLGKGWDDAMAWYRETPFALPSTDRGEPAVDEIPPQAEGLGYRCGGSGNEVGLCISIGGGAVYEYEAKPDRVLFPVPVNDLVLRSCATVYEAVEMLIRYNSYWGPCNLVVGDAQGRGALFEKSRYTYAVRMSGRNVLITTYGGCEEEDMRALCDTSTALFVYYERRLQVMKEIVAEAEAGEGLDLDVYWRSILHHDEEAPGCTHQETRPEGIELFTFGAYAHLPREGRSLARTLARVDGGLRYGCETPAVESRWRFT
jgi:hypothetical protein